MGTSFQSRVLPFAGFDAHMDDNVLPKRKMSQTAGGWPEEGARKTSDLREDED